MKPSLEHLTQEFTALIGPEAFAKAAAASAAAAAAAAAAKPAPAPAAAKPAVAKPAPSGVAGLAEPGPGSPTPATTAKPAAATVAKPAPSGVAGLAEPGPGSATPAAAAKPAAAAPAVAPKPAAPAPAPKPAAPALPPPPASPLQAVAPTQKGYDLDATVASDQVIAAATLLDRQGFGLDAITGVDWIAQNEMEVVYDYFHPTEPLRVVVRARVPRDNPVLPTISSVFPGANWHERETHDFFGIRFAGHPNLTPFLLPEDATFHPLRKDYSP